jgi:glycosyltransferase involved in cell wall biosynthesis
MTREQLAIVCPNLSSNGLGRAMLLAELASAEYDVRIIGYQNSPEQWLPAVSSKIPIHSYRLEAKQLFASGSLRWFREQLQGSRVLVSKPTLRSFGAVLAAGFSPRDILLDIDDWETGFAQIGADEAGSLLGNHWDRLRSYTRRFGVNGFVVSRALEAAARSVKLRITSNSWLQRRFGGAILYHVRDARTLDPATEPNPVLSRDRPWFGFVGTVKPHKGVGVLIDALRQVHGPGAPGLAIFGAAPTHPEIVRARETLGEERFFLGQPFAFDQLPQRLASVDVLTVPSLDVPSARGQIPAKLFDALAMGRPVLGSRLNDIPTIVGDAGRCVPPGDVAAMRDAVVELAGSAGLRAELGRRARQRFLSGYTYDHGRAVLLPLLKQLKPVHSAGHIRISAAE